MIKKKDYVSRKELKKVIKYFSELTELRINFYSCEATDKTDIANNYIRREKKLNKKIDALLSDK